MANATKPIVFLSFDLEHDEPARLRFVEQMDKCAVSFSVNHWTTGERPIDGRNSLVRSRISDASLMIVLVSERTHLSSMVAAEIQLSRGANVPFFGVYSDSTPPSCELPADLPRNRIITWDWQLIGAALEQVMKEGKHHIFK